MRRQARKWIIYISFLAIFVGVLIRGFLYETFRVATPAMEPALLIGDLVVVSKFAYGFQWPENFSNVLDIDSPSVGDTVLYGAGSNLSVGRIFGTPGMSVANREGEFLEIKEGQASNGGQTLTVPAGHFLVLPEQKSFVRDLERYLVSQGEIVGQATRVWFSLDWSNKERPSVRWKRLFKRVR